MIGCVSLEKIVAQQSMETVGGWKWTQPEGTF